MEVIERTLVEVVCVHYLYLRFSRGEARTYHPRVAPLLLL